jgi:cytochrome d ubiquinol oxidase subunit II
MLLGIIARGTAFAFRNYDAVVDSMQKIYNKVFVYSSFVTPLFLGIIAGSAVSGRIDMNAGNFADAYIYSWFNWFSVAVGFFTVSICGYLAAIFIIGETDSQEDRIRFVRKTRHMNVAAVITGTLVFIAAYFENIPLFEWVFGNAIGRIAISAALASLIVMWVLLLKGRTRILRVLAGFQVTMILLTVTVRHYPNIIILKGNKYLSLLENAGHERTIYWLAMALLIGSVFILPALYYLLYSFHKKTL